MKPHPKQAFRNLLERFKVPPKFELERQQAVNHAVGTYVHTDSQTNGKPRCFNERHQQTKTDYSSAVTWFRLVCKNVNIVEDRQTGRWNIQGSDIYSDRSWFDSSYVLIEQRGSQGVTLLCFGISESLEHRFDELRPDREFSEQPWSIFAVVFQALFVEMDVVAWKLADVFRSTEEVSNATQD